MKTINFLAWPTLIGLIVAGIMIYFGPQFLPSPAGNSVTTNTDNTLAGSKQENLAGISVSNHPHSGPVSYTEAVTKAAPAVVNIYTTKTVTRKLHPFFSDPFFKRFLGGSKSQKRLESSLGSGVIVDQQGYILTNHHVIKDADEILVAIQDGRYSKATVAGVDAETDLAVLHVNLPDLPVITLPATKSAAVGDVVLAIGNPFGIGQTVTLGIVSATGRKTLGLNNFEDFIQTDAAINPGNSGGALIDAYGNLMGINTAIFSRSGGSQGIGFAIPAELALDVLQQIITNGRVIRGWLGMEVKMLTPIMAASMDIDYIPGMLISRLMENGPGHQAGLQPGDIITHLDSQSVNNPLYTMNAIARSKPGKKIALQINRNGEKIKLNATIGTRPEISS